MTKEKIVRHTTEELKEIRTKGKSKTDWKAIKKTKEEDIVFDADGPEISDQFWKEAKIVEPESKAQLTIRLDRYILDFFKSQGKGYQTKINAVLKSYVESQTQ